MPSCGCCSGAIRAASHGRTALSREEATSLQSSVVSRLKAEQTVSFVAQAREVFEDMHLVYAGVGGAAAALVCVVIMLGDDALCHHRAAGFAGRQW